MSITFANEKPTQNSSVCSAAHDLVRQKHLFENKEKNQILPRQLIIEGVNVLSQRHVLEAYTAADKPDDVVSVKQKDYGVVIGLFFDRGGNITVLGDQTSYRVKIKTLSGKAEFHELEKLPTLYRQKCGLSEKLFGACQQADVYYSKEIRAAFSSGMDALGVKRSYAFGLGAKTVEELSLPGDATPVYFFDIPESGYAFFKDMYKNDFYIFDGEQFRACE